MGDYKAKEQEWRADRRAMLELLDRGSSVREIAEMRGISTQAAGKRLRKAIAERAQERRAATRKAKHEQAQA